LESWVASELELDRAEDWILHIMHLAQTKNGQHLLPRQIFITKVLERLGNSRREKAAYHTGRLLRMLLDVENYLDTAERLITHDAYNRAIQIWTKSNDEEAPFRAENLLWEMQQRSENGERK
jgi:hypothetical protein